MSFLISMALSVFFYGILPAFIAYVFARLAFDDDAPAPFNPLYTDPFFGDGK